MTGKKQSDGLPGKEVKQFGRQEAEVRRITMLLHILKKDVKRKTSMNLILLLFIIMATTFMASSANNLVTVCTTVDDFLAKAITPDEIIIMQQDGSEGMLEQFLDESESVRKYAREDMFIIAEDKISILECAEEPDRKVYERDNTLSIGTIPKEFMKVFDENGESITLKNGEIALPRGQAEMNHLEKGDKLLLQSGERELEVTVTAITMDAVFSPEMIGFKRAFVSEEDYTALKNESSQVMNVFLYSIVCSDTEKFEEMYLEQQFKIVSKIDETTIRMCYLFDMLIAGILIIVSICLILISLLILRFTIVFTLQEDYREIGIMKAIGIHEWSIRRIYLMKYLAIAVIGSTIGFVLSLPFQQLLLRQILINIVASDLESSFLINLSCSVGIVAIILLFCYQSAGKVKRFTAIQAIRNGGDGERFQTKSKLVLHHNKRFRANTYLACNDILSGFRRYLVMLIIFCIGSLLILLPLTAIHTLKDKQIIKTLTIMPSDAHFNNKKLESYFLEKNNEKVLSDMEDIEEKMAENGLHADVWIDFFYMFPCYGSDEKKTTPIYTKQTMGTDLNDYEVLEGQVAVQKNEVMITSKVADELGVGIGDYITFVLNEEKERYLVTGIFQTMVNMGECMRIGPEAKLDYTYASGCQSMQMNVEENLTYDELKSQLLKLYPDWEIKNTNEVIRDAIGNVLDTLDGLKYWLLVIVLLINILITVLMMKTLSSGEHGEIAMLKSIGFPEHSIRGWQVKRILIILGGSILLGMILTKFMAPLALAPIFNMLGGTNIHIVMNPLESFVAVPMILFTGTSLAAYLCSLGSRKVDSKEINTME